MTLEFCSELLGWGLQMVLSLGYEVLWSDMDAVWLKNFFQLAPQGLDYVGVDDSDAENEMVSPPAFLPCFLSASPTNLEGCILQPAGPQSIGTCSQNFNGATVLLQDKFFSICWLQQVSQLLQLL